MNSNILKVTANHLGYFEFRLCNTDKLGGQDASQECLDKTILGDKFGKKRFNIGNYYIILVNN
jgi:hypothetical protein